VGWKEQMTAVAVPGEGLVLEALWQSGTAGGAVIAPPHPLYGGSLGHPVCNELAHGFYRAGLASLRFNWRGVGASQGSPSGDVHMAERDYRAALEHLVATVPAPAVAAGYSFGAVAALRVALGAARVDALVLVAPPAAMLAELPLEGLAVPVHVLAGARDEIASPARLAAQLERVARAHLEVVPAADHFFAAQGLAEIGSLAQRAGAAALEGA
jgi:alpha/beta superfamily hydrolase